MTEDLSFSLLLNDIEPAKSTTDNSQPYREAFSTLAESTPDTISRYDRNCLRTYANPAFVHLSKMPMEALLGKKPCHYISTPQMLAYEAKLQEVLHSGKPTAFETHWMAANGEQVYQHVRVVPEFDQHGRIMSVLTIARDISTLKKTERRLEEAEAMALLGHWQMNYLLDKLSLSAEFCRLFGKPRNWSPRPNEIIAMFARVDRGRVIGSIRQAYASRAAELTLDYSIEAGQRRLHLHSCLRIEYAEDGTPLQLLGTAQDVSELKAYQQQLHTLAFYDALTGLPNRKLLVDRLQQAMVQADCCGRQVIVMILDLDNFKMVNDTVGHDAGDELLRETAQHLQRSVRNCDTVARLGGDEFALILSEVANDANLDKIGYLLLQTISGAYRIKGREVFVSGSLGLARYPADGDSIAALLQYAESAMYHAKEQGRDNIQFYSPRLTRQTTQRLALAASLRHAQRNGELELYYQPQIELSSGQLIGAEALLRWKHPQEGWVPPDRFIPIAEETGLIVGIGEWVLYSACRSVAAWNSDRRSSPPLKIGVNLSPRQFKMNDLLASIRSILQATGCHANWLELEITEGMLLENSIAVRETLEQLRAMGLSIAIDDFGTGYSALSYLNRFPIETLKIDRSFIRDIDSNRDSAELVKAIISMAHSLHLKLVAEGVEDLTQEAFLRRHVCHSGQGYLYGKPIPREAFERLLFDEDNRP
jgi:diguanylate cyclase (GGDEF)-like protein/PAS domain S-box-containing protein